MGNFSVDSSVYVLYNAVRLPPIFRRLAEPNGRRVDCPFCRTCPIVSCCSEWSYRSGDEMTPEICCTSRVRLARLFRRTTPCGYHAHTCESSSSSNMHPLWLFPASHRRNGNCQNAAGKAARPLVNDCGLMPPPSSSPASNPRPSRRRNSWLVNWAFHTTLPRVFMSMTARTSPICDPASSSHRWNSSSADPTSLCLVGRRQRTPSPALPQRLMMS